MPHLLVRALQGTAGRLLSTVHGSLRQGCQYWMLLPCLVWRLQLTHNLACRCAEAHVVPGLEGHSLEDLMDLMLPQVQARDALPPLPRHIGQNPAPELPPRPPSALAIGASCLNLQSLSLLHQGAMCLCSWQRPPAAQKPPFYSAQRYVAGPLQVTPA